ncbi:MAG: hypothetical protein ACXVJD_13470 [Mucilaginibacter sp.]
MMNIKLLLLFASACFALSCTRPVKPGDLYGKWRYIKIEHPHTDAPDIAADELKKQAASIEFSSNNTFVIMWGGKMLSHGKFTTEDNKILIKEELPDGTTRSFPFYISELTAKEMLFETKSGMYSKVTAVKE